MIWQKKQFKVAGDQKYKDETLDMTVYTFFQPEPFKS